LALDLRISGIDAGYGAVRALHGVSMEIRQGETVALLGTNGNGKSTLMKCIMGMVRPTRGAVSLDLDGKTHDLTRLSTEEIVNLGVAMVPEGRRLFPRLSVEENLLLGAFRKPARPDIGRNLAFSFEIFPVLAERRRQLAGSLSGGQQQMLAIGMALMHAPRLIILDEPSIGLAPNLVDKVMQAIREVNRRFGTTIVMVEQNVRYSLPIADRVAVLKTGLKIYDGPPDPLHDRVELMKLF
jgi:branched-chain amino acid transport system ATP-binding protein